MHTPGKVSGLRPVTAWPPFGGGMRVGVRVGVRVVDLDTGISAAVDCSRRQYQNKKMALELVEAMTSYARENPDAHTG